MSDNLQEREPQEDRERVNLGKPDELRFWTRELGCTEQQLREAVAKVGTFANGVRREVKEARLRK